MDIIGEATNHDELIAVLRSRKAALELTDALLDHLTGLPDGYCNKLLGPAPVKALGGLSLSSLLGALALKLVVIVDEQQIAHIGKRWKPKAKNRAHPATYTLGQARPVIMARLGEKGRRVRWGKLTPEQRSEFGRRLINRRWGRNT